jgi:hypothetical protein
MSDLRSRVDTVWTAGAREGAQARNIAARARVEPLSTKEASMPGKRGSTSKHRSNTTGKAGNAAGPARRESRGSAAGGAGRGGVHPPNKLFTAPQKEKLERARVRTGRGQRQSDRGDNPRD